jgi:hypothetical protein
VTGEKSKYSDGARSMRAVKGSLGHSLQDRHEKSEGRLLVSVLISQPDRLIFSLGSVYRGGTMRETLDVKRETKDTTDWLSVR